MSQVIAQEIDFHPTQSVHRAPTISTRNKSPQHQKQALIKKIELLMQSNDQLEVKQESLQNTIYDLRKLITLTKKQGEEAIEHLHSQIGKYQQKRQRASAALKYSQRDGNHLQKCMFFWNQFL